MAEERTKVEIGFGIGQAMSVKLTDAELKDLRKAVEAGSGWYDLQTEDGTVAVNLASVVFVRVHSDAHRIGFAG
jgi:hypothetical protein